MEAYAHTHDILPHLHRELNSLFPRAVAKEEETECEDTIPFGFETRGGALGKAVEATAKSAMTAATTKTDATTTTTATVVERQAVVETWGTVRPAATF